MIEVLLRNNPNGTQTYMKARVIFQSMKKGLRTRIELIPGEITGLPDSKRHLLDKSFSLTKRVPGFKLR